MKDKDKLQEAILKADMKSAEKIWKELDGEQTLASLLEKMTKDELVKIAKKYDVKGITSLKKAEAVERIREVVINNEDHMINSLEETSIKFLQELINDGGVKKYQCDLLINSDIKTIHDDVIKAIGVARQKLLFHRLNKTKNKQSLINFSATLVGFFYCKNQGIFFHIGDGAGIAFKEGEYNHFVISEPENGAFSCETYFYTMDDWQESLRFTNFENVNRVMLMTDGVTGFVFSGDFYKIHRNFLVPIVEYLESESRKTYAVEALCNTLNNSKAQRINADDKTILWAKLQ